MKLKRYTVGNPPVVSEEEKRRNLAEEAARIWDERNDPGRETDWWNWFNANERLVESYDY